LQKGLGLEEDWSILKKMDVCFTPKSERCFAKSKSQGDAPLGSLGAGKIIFLRYRKLKKFMMKKAARVFWT